MLSSGRVLRGWAGIFGLALLQSACALQPLSDWIDGIATYYGGQADGMDPYSPSYGTQDVTASPVIVGCAAARLHHALQ